MKILCVDDEKDILILMSEFLELLGFDAVTATDAQQALEIFEEEHSEFAAVITDIKMPRMSGLDLLSEIRSKGYTIPVIMASGQYDEDMELLSEKYVATTILAKPFNLMQLADMLKKIFEQ